MSWLTAIIDFFASYGMLPKIVAVISGVICLATLIIFAPKRLDTKVSIETPKNNDSVNWSFVVKGTYKNLPKKDYDLWIITSDGKRYWPQEKITPYDTLNWQGHVKGIGGTKGKARTFGVYLVGKNGQALMALYDKANDNQPKLEISDLTNDIESLQEITVIYTGTK